MYRIDKIKYINDNFRKIGLEALRNTKQWSDQISEDYSFVDIVILFSKSTKEELINWVRDLMNEQVPQLKVQKVFHKISSQYAFYLKCDTKDLLVGAERICLKKRLHEELGGQLADFSLDCFSSFQGYENEADFFSSEERIIITNHYLSRFRAKSSIDQFKIKLRKGDNITNKLQSSGYIDQIFPLHDIRKLENLKEKWLSNFSFGQPIEMAREYFGVRTGFYFAWMDHYTRSLIFPAILSLLYWICKGSNHDKENKHKCIYYTLSVIVYFIWMTFYLTSWKRTSNRYAYQWGTIDQPSDLLEEPRPEFKGSYELCPITKTYRCHYPRNKRLAIMLFVSLPISLISMICIIVFSLFMREVQESAELYCENLAKKEELKMNYFYNEIVKMIPNVLFSLGVLLFDSFYRYLSKYLTDMENHRLDNEYQSFFIGRLFIFQFFNAYFFPFFMAFIKKDLDTLVSILSTTLVMRQIVGNVKEFFLPFGVTKWKQFLISFRYEKSKINDESKIEILNQPNLDDNPSHINNHPNNNIKTPTNQNIIWQAENEAIKIKYDDSADDYLEMVIQFGYISMFAAVFPLGPIFALANNVIEIRSDAYKIITSYQRPLPKNSNNIGIWQKILDFMSYIGIMTNLGLLFLNGTVDHYLPNFQKYQQVLILVAIEHFIIGLKVLMDQSIPSIPENVQESMAVIEFKRREAFKAMEKELRKDKKND